MTRPTEAQAAKIENRIEALHSASRHVEAYRLQGEYWDACNLSPEVRAQLEAARMGGRSPRRMGTPTTEDEAAEQMDNGHNTGGKVYSRLSRQAQP